MISLGPSLSTPRSKRRLLSVALILSITPLALSACQPQSEPKAAGEEAQISVQDNQQASTTEVTPMSEAAQAQVTAYEAQFVNSMLDLQQSQKAEYEALQAADAPQQAPDNKLKDDQTNEQQNEPNATKKESEQQGSQGVNLQSVGADTQPNVETEEDQQAELQPLPLINLAAMPPEQLTAVEISNRYNVALQSLYLADEVPMPPQAVDTLLNIATLTPQVFNNAELAERLVKRSPALARLLQQHQAWEQQQKQQSEQLETLKQEQLEQQQQQAAEFDKLSKEFNDKIKDYDQQIEQYQQKLEQFE